MFLSLSRTLTTYYLYILLIQAFPLMMTGTGTLEEEQRLTHKTVIMKSDMIGIYSIDIVAGFISAPSLTQPG